MDDRQEETIDPIIVDGFTNTLIPFFSWCLSQFSLALLGCKLILVLRHPTTAYRERVVDSWVKRNELFSCSEILGFQTSSGRRRCRKKLKKILRPFFRKMSRSQECILLRHRLQEEWSRLAEIVNGIPPEIPRKVVKQYDIDEIEKRRDKEFGNFSAEDLLDTFPIGQTVKPHLVSHVISEVGDYGETVRSLWWEASRDWRITRQIRIRKNSKIWTLLGIDPDVEPDMEQMINISLDFALGQVDDDKLLRLARWVMGRILVSQFLKYPYSEKKLISVEKEIADEVTLEDRLADYGTQEEFLQKEDAEILSIALSELPAAQREASELFLRAESPQALRQELGEKEYKNKERNFERALKKLKDLRESGKLGT